MNPEPVDWRRRYEDRDTPWDLGGPHPELAARLARGGLLPAGSPIGAGQGPRALVPGCGRGHDALALARAGFRVTAVDLVDATGGVLGRELEQLGGELRVEDALRHRGAYDVLFEHTFFCALDPEQRGAWGLPARENLVPGGKLWALVFPVGKPAAEGGPPFATAVEDLARVLPGFSLCVDVPAGARAPKRSWEERWAEFERLS